MPEALLWWFVLFAIGLIAFPITHAVLRPLPDRGYTLSRPLGLVLAVYLFWVLGTLRLIPNTTVGVILTLLPVAGVSVRLATKHRRSLWLFFRHNWGVVLATEAVWALTFVAWGLVRSHAAAIAHTEQPMDFALLNGILQSPHFPPEDPWFAGQPISYYYGGYLIAAFLTHLTGIPASITYNLSLMSTAAMAGAGVMGLAYGIVRWQNGRIIWAILAGVLASGLLLFAGNFEGLLEYVRANGLAGAGFFRWLGISGLTATPGTEWYPTETWWWWKATRVINTFVNGQGIDYTITEFPLFSFVLGDLHPHVMALPYGLLALGISLSFLRSRQPAGIAWLQRHGWTAAVFGVALGSLGFINTWDLPTFMTVLLGAMLLRTLHARARGQRAGYVPMLGLWLVLLVAAVAAYAPFYAGLSTQANGILPERRVMTRPVHFLIVLGPLLLLNLTLLAAVAWRTLGPGAAAWLAGRRPTGVVLPATASLVAEPARPPAPLRLRPDVLWLGALPVAPFLLWAAVEATLGFFGSDKLLAPGQSASLAASFLAIGSRSWHVLPLMVIAGVAIIVGMRLAQRGASAGLQFATLLIAMAFTLTLGAELFRIADQFGNRMNTVFKFYYQVWMLLTISGVAGFCYWIAETNRQRLPRKLAAAGVTGVLVLGLIAAFAFAPPAAMEKTGRFSGTATLDGLQSLKNNSPEEYAAVQWLLVHSKQGDVILEGVPGSGQPSGDYDVNAGRMSQRTGLPTLLGWPGHEHQWRGGSYDPIQARFTDVVTVYRTGTPDQIKTVLARYNVRYIIVGDLELRTYGERVAARLDGIAGPAFSLGNTYIYERSA